MTSSFGLAIEPDVFWKHLRVVRLVETGLLLSSLVFTRVRDRTAAGSSEQTDTSAEIRSPPAGIHLDLTASFVREKESSRRERRSPFPGTMIVFDSSNTFVFVAYTRDRWLTVSPLEEDRRGRNRNFSPPHREIENIRKIREIILVAERRILKKPIPTIVRWNNTEARMVRGYRIAARRHRFSASLFNDEWRGLSSTGWQEDRRLYTSR